MNRQDRLGALLDAARRAGADGADALLVESASLAVGRRLGQIEQLERSESVDFGLRVFLGRRVATVSGTDASPEGFAALAERAVAMARVVPEDPHAEIPDVPAAADASGLDLDDHQEPSAEALLDRAAAAEEAALAVSGVSNSEGASAGWTRGTRALATSRGFFGEYVRGSHSLSATALAGEGTGMQRDYDYSAATHLADLDAPEVIGRKAGEQAVARLNPTRPRSGTVPVVYHPRVANSLLSHLANAINGASIARGTSFLRDAMGKQILPAGMTVWDDPLRARGLRSRPFDGEGVPGRRLALVEGGVLRSWLLDSRSARQLSLASTGHAARGTGGPPTPSPSNLWVEAGAPTPDALMADIREGLFVTELIGMGVNGVTGDYSRGAAGFMIRDGRLAEPVSEITIAGRLPEMFLALSAASDLVFRRGTDAPTLRVEGMTLAGA
ncbi:TldD/PmbA family protein [Sabulicella glaciei]|uniref:TldD/PmbA family protein n=1 Tax=Sabulicella glaciei TaxID=2984948 RepID=A0ABT3NVM7_9PROT|nr:TldD/PmbA family protein [Roseococcus sp. MDT2-1-1]